MKGKRKKISMVFVAASVLLMGSMTVFAAETQTQLPTIYATIWSLLPSVVAIGLALITKEVYSSLFIGVCVGALFYSNFSFEGTVMTIYEKGILGVLTDSYNMGIIIFLVILGAMVSLMNKAGGSKAFGNWASEHIHSKTGTQIVTILLGILLFIDDYFNCLTVGSVMRPVTDKYKVSRAKLAYLIDATAAPICIIAPISSWAAAVSGFVEGEDGLALFVKAIPYNFYALLTIAMMIGMVLLKIEFGPMAEHEKNADAGDLFTTDARPYEGLSKDDDQKTNGSVIDLIIPIICLVVCCVIGMLYTGGFFDGEGFVTAFSQSDASVGLALGSFFGFIITILLYAVRKVLKFQECMQCLAEGFKSMVPAILILTFAWTLKSITDGLGAKEFVADIMTYASGNLVNFLPAIIFVVGCFLAFATGTSWGTFGILIPIVVAVFSGTNYELMIISISACMAGAVCGDHCSPISDTTIMASAGAQCDHVNHVSTQLPYAMLVAVVSFLSYIFAGFVQSAWISLPFAFILMAATLFLVKNISEKRSVN